MTREIAVYEDQSGVTASFEQDGKIVIYRKIKGAWKVLREKGLFGDKILSLKELRKRMDNITDFLGECRIFVGASIAGIPYFSLEKHGCNLWEIEGRPQDFLDLIIESEEEEKSRESERKLKDILPIPLEVFPGRYIISIKEIQEKDLGITSKQVLRPYLQKGRFYELEVTAGHVPPWLEGDLMVNDLNSRVDQVSENEIKITITKKTCDEK
ncbi:Fe-only nitrogenase accessory AnfO family protein [Candidatus Contubernalis alkaliaceticus]|uniref:Fe-only nitrogenase accessory AnfO family protein n=1 Tax=Candidatus Contubernalis alkaliaceticus TaxID=338645 RepID=UPI001F4BD44C|nr:Fe-only nitrogenase accessory AnfO family protein [Candidatus Contubernalis alkalaceticus]UNC92659.1 nitrogenase [Candidatus Contubernalis alkalaceticus]